jgi:predicted amidohydrolase YtcJ
MRLLSILLPSVLSAAVALSPLCSAQQTQQSTAKKAPDKSAAQPGSPDPKIKADIIFFHGIILTGEGLAEGKPRVVTAMAIANGKVLAVGTDKEVTRLAGSHTRLRDLDSASTETFLMPGLNDAHVHLGGAGLTKLNVDLTGVKSLDEMLKIVKEDADKSPTGHWLTGGGWDHTLWSDKTLPTRQDLDKVTGDHPTLLERIDGHIAIANTAALKAAGITGTSKAPQGGSIDLDSNGEPTGILRDTEMEELEKIIPPPTHDERKRGLKLAIADALAHGLTSVQDNSPWEDFLVYEELEKEGKLGIRISEWLPFDAPIDILKDHRAHHDARDPMLHTGMLKGFMDGSLGSHTAAMKAPFADEPNNSGLARYDQVKLDAMAIERSKAGFQIGFHAIGDKAAAMALNAFAAAGPEAKPHRNRIEHAQVVDPTDIARFKQLGVIASMQPNHLLTDMNWAMDRLGPQRAATSYAWKAFLDAGVVLAFGTDYPVEPVTPFRGLYAAVTRANEAGTKTYFPAAKLTRAQAIYAYTQGSAYAEFAEKHKGKLVPGYDADFILLDRNLLNVAAPSILHTKVLETVVNGKTVYPATDDTQASQ